jgi:hypothetical protein
MLFMKCQFCIVSPYNITHVRDGMPFCKTIEKLDVLRLLGIPN